MENEGISSGSRRSGNDLRAERSCSSTAVFCAARVGGEVDGAAPKCYCRAYAILYLSMTMRNPNRLFFGCPYYKGPTPHCSFFRWLDRHIAMFSRKENVKCEEVEADANEHISRLTVDNRLGELEDRIAAIEKKKVTKMFVLVMCLVVLAISFWAARF
ncbi:hypothetical protein PIB30_043812 [Stylosanthes scabra]|uniref:GRF-type domain-containing protein n=1 Tax=Stylosanthes scabra TaxID=79078 RepID=A0ABU6UEB2_9FABA|nr:hypothetical protein [Stylosanthes scabra]